MPGTAKVVTRHPPFMKDFSRFLFTFFPFPYSYNNQCAK